RRAAPSQRRRGRASRHRARSLRGIRATIGRFWPTAASGRHGGGTARPDGNGYGLRPRSGRPPSRSARRGGRDAVARDDRRSRGGDTRRFHDGPARYGAVRRPSGEGIKGIEMGFWSRFGNLLSSGAGDDDDFDDEYDDEGKHNVVSFGDAKSSRRVGVSVYHPRRYDEVTEMGDALR